MMPLMAHQLFVTYSGRSQAVLKNMTLQCAAGHWIGIIGPNGAGKSTLLKALAGLMPSQGQIMLNGRPLNQWSLRQRALSLAWLGTLELSPIADDWRVCDLVFLGRIPHRRWWAGWQDKDHLAVKNALLKTRLWDYRERVVGELSAGERQRLLLARMLAVEAPIWLLDEPLMNLDPPHQIDMLHLIRQHVNQGGLVLSVLHDMNWALQADDLWVIAKQGLVYSGVCNSSEARRSLESVFDHRITVQPLDHQWVILPRTEPIESEVSHIVNIEK